MRRRRCIDPVIALIILIGVAVAIAVAFAGWALNLWNVQSKAGEAIQVAGSTYDPETGILKIRLIVHIKPKAVIYKIDVTGAGISRYWVDNSDVEAGTVTYDSDTGKIIASVGSKFWVSIQLANPKPPGTSVEIRIYTETGYMYRTVVVL